MCRIGLHVLSHEILEDYTSNQAKYKNYISTLLPIVEVAESHTACLAPANLNGKCRLRAISGNYPNRKSFKLRHGLEVSKGVRSCSSLLRIVFHHECRHRGQNNVFKLFKCSADDEICFTPCVRKRPAAAVIMLVPCLTITDQS